MSVAAPPPDPVVPVPLHPLRLRERGYNQAAKLARFGARIALVDDVITSGSTAGATAAALRVAGASGIELWVVTRVARRQAASQV